MLNLEGLRARLRFLLGASVLAIASPATAQNAAAPAGSIDNAASSAEPALEDIVVTAQKREENLQAVPIAISAISAAKVEQLGIKDARDISGLAPNVTVVQGAVSNAASVFSIRGISNGGAETFGVDNANGLYVDGVYIGRTGASALEVMDIARIEVLRGPQGTLFGRNTTGGAIAFISRAPSKDFQLKGETGYGNFDSWNAKIALDTGMIAGIATTVSYSHRQRNGVVDNILEPRKSRDPGAVNADAFRAAARAELGGTGSIQYIFDWSKTEGSPQAFELTNISDGTIRPPAIIDGQPVVVTQQAPAARYLAAATFLEPQCRALGAAVRTYRKQVCNNISSFATDKIWGHNIQVANDFDAFKIKSTTGYRFWHSFNNSDLDGLGTIAGPAFTQATLLNGLPVSLLQFIPTVPAAARAFVAAAAVPTTTQGFFDSRNRRRHKQFSQEVEISGNTDQFDWVFGGFYFFEKGSENGLQSSGFVLDTNSIFLGSFGALGPSLAAANPARYRLVPTLATLIYTATAESTAIYGQTTFYPGGRDSGVRLTAGGRYTWDNKRLVRAQNGAAPLATPELGQARFSKFTWNLMAGYDIAERVNAYARVATGYRSGGFNSQDGAIPGTNTLPSFSEETILSYEGGIKSEFFNRRLRLNVAGYHNIYDNLAVNIPRTDAPIGTFVSRIGNAGKVTYTGFEIETQAVLTDYLTAEGNVGYVYVKNKEIFGGQSTTAGAAPVNIASVFRSGYTSPLTANAALNTVFPLAWGEARLVGRVSYTYEDGKYSFVNSIGTPFNEQLKGDNRDIVDAQIGIDRIAIGGGEANVRLWVKNLTNAHDFARGIDFGQLGYAGGFYADPRTYGVTVGMKF